MPVVHLAAIPFSRAQRGALLVAFALLVALRLPGAWVHGRFLDEEATVFLAYAWHHGAMEALFRPFAGYLNLGATATTLVVARLVQGGAVALERAPYLTMTAALAVQLLPAVLLLTGRARWLSDRRAVLAALLAVALAPGSEEVFLNVLHIQFHLALCAALILALDPPDRLGARIGHAALLTVAPLCGPGAIVVLPLFALRALLDRDAERWRQFAAFALGTAVQLVGFYGASPMRGHLQNPPTIAAAVFVRMVVLPALNFGNAVTIGDAIHHSRIDGGVGWLIAGAGAAVLFGGLLVLASRRRDAAVWLLMSSLGVAVASFGFGMVIVRRSDLFSVDMGGRYNFLPLVLLAWALIALAMRRTRGSRMAGWACALLLVNGAVRYPAPVPHFDAGPSWPVEVAAWRRDHRHPLAVWPRPWRADLSDRARACTGRPADPRYCEAGWVAGFAPYREPELR